MIDESHPWKQLLLRSARWLSALRIAEDNQDKSPIRLEREVFFSFYAIRKLCDTLKVTDKTKAMRIGLTYYPCVAEVDYLNRRSFQKLYDLDSPQNETRDLGFICNQFIHSYVFEPIYDESFKIAGFYVNSDKTRTHKLYFVDLEQVIEIFRTVGRDKAKHVYMHREGPFEKLEWKVS
jgi:hypothetical protein